jgi:hypothetical protein
MEYAQRRNVAASPTTLPDARGCSNTLYTARGEGCRPQYAEVAAGYRNHYPPCSLHPQHLARNYTLLS